MSEGQWFERLLGEVAKAEAEGRKLKDISRKAGKGPNFLSQMRGNRKVPSIENFLRVCAALEVSPIYIITGTPMTPKGQALFELVSSLSESDQNRLLDMAERFATFEQPRPESNSGSSPTGG